MKKYSLLALCFAMILSLTAGPSSAQETDSCIYAPVAEHLRPRLRERLKEYVEAERAQRFERIYDLLSESDVKDLMSRGRGTKADYAAFQKGMGKYRMHIVNFVPTRIASRDDGSFIVFGQYRTDHGEAVTEGRGSLEAHWERGDWYFSEMAVEIE